MSPLCKEPFMRKWHRRIGIILVPFLLVQALSGLIIALQVLLGIHHSVSDLLNARKTHTLHYLWDYLLLEIHYGGGMWGNIYHISLVVGIIWILFSGTNIYLKVRSRCKKVI